MAIYHCSIKILSRSSGRSAVAAAAYRSGERLEDEETGIVHDYTRKGGVLYTGIELPANAPEEYQDRATLWNAVEQVEKKGNAQLAREIEVALPTAADSFSQSMQRNVLMDFVHTLTAEGMCADWAIHDKGDGNPHAHILLTTRAIKENGEWAQKEKKAYKLDENGERIPVIDPATGAQKLGKRNERLWERETVQANDWNSRDKAEEWRTRWEECCNRYLSEANRIDHRSYARQGIDQEPTVHEGFAARQIERRGGVSEICQANREIKATNAAIKKNAAQRDALRRLIDALNELKEKIAAMLQEIRQRASAISGTFTVWRLRDDIRSKQLGEMETVWKINKEVDLEWYQKAEEGKLTPDDTPWTAGSNIARAYGLSDFDLIRERRTGVDGKPADLWSMVEGKRVNVIQAEQVVMPEQPEPKEEPAPAEPAPEQPLFQYIDREKLRVRHKYFGDGTLVSWNSIGSMIKTFDVQFDDGRTRRVAITKDKEYDELQALQEYELEQRAQQWYDQQPRHREDEWDLEM